MMALHAAQMLIGLALEAMLGWPMVLYRLIGHPVSWLGHLIALGDRHWNDESEDDDTRQSRGTMLALGIILLAGGVAMALSLLLVRDWTGAVVGGILAWPLLAARSLHDHVAAVAEPLAAGDVLRARKAVSMIVGRSPEKLDKAAITRAAAESLAENTSDGVIAPLFWGVLLGLPGIAAYKAINTLDSMIAYRTARHLFFGRTAAKIDDIANWVPARLTGLLYVLASNRPATALRVMLSDARNHRSPNAGWPEAAFAGALGIRLSGPRLYAEGPSEDAWLNGKAPDPQPANLLSGLKLYRRVVVLAALCAATPCVIALWKFQAYAA
ncbi:adenosylcobinamide-phosphate synthase CbiB [Novosphingobium terrae]|uniref:adenosylcobinamide-phosphate synthase CbiB n=1 Tax=Novosphingobium terrae TaxID=2726189 RepID=UPI001F131D88|nr:adenosylcobinamide-phosphate synthase CbiB [Novosphingobium terrae]